MMTRKFIALVGVASAVLCAPTTARLGAQSQPQSAPSHQPAQQSPSKPAQENQDAFRFRTGVELINVNATVTDQNGRFVSGLQQDDFRVFQDDQPQPITHFNAERVPVSLGIVLDTSGSMEGEKMAAARDALNSFLAELNDPDDEVFLYRFDSIPTLVEGWTRDKRRLSYALDRIRPRGGTALYDAVADAIPLVQAGHNRKKALVIISDGNDTSSRTDIVSLKQLIRETEVLIYAIGIDSPNTFGYFPSRLSQLQRPPRMPTPWPFPIPGRRNPPSQPPPSWPPGNHRNPNDDRVNVTALREITDDSGGRTEIVRNTRDLDPATSGIADELSRQYYIGYPSTGAKDGRWHTIRVDVRNPAYHVRARRGFVATP
jgi:Ca-activated chloride channel homolog